MFGKKKPVEGVLDVENIKKENLPVHTTILTISGGMVKGVVHGSEYDMAQFIKSMFDQLTITGKVKIVGELFERITD